MKFHQAHLTRESENIHFLKERENREEEEFSDPERLVLSLACVLIKD